jgi:hypothetical protein
LKKLTITLGVGEPMATIGVRPEGDKIRVWIVGPRGGRQEFVADHATAILLRAKINQAIEIIEEGIKRFGEEEV